MVLINYLARWTCHNRNTTQNFCSTYVQIWLMINERSRATSVRVVLYTDAGRHFGSSFQTFVAVKGWCSNRSNKRQRNANSFTHLSNAFPFLTPSSGPTGNKKKYKKMHHQSNKKSINGRFITSFYLCTRRR